MRRQIILDIIEGRKKLVGVDVCHVEDDGEHVRSITDKLMEQSQKLQEQEIRLIMNASPLLFVDPYSTVRSLRALHEGSVKDIDTNNLMDIRRYFGGIYRVKQGFSMYETLPSLDEPTRCGLWLFDEPELVARIVYENDVKPGTDTFWAEIYEKTKERPGFEERNANYEFALQEAERKRQYIENAQKQDETASEYAHFMDETGEAVKPDDIKSWQGLIAPNGDFYSCGFGEHAAKAMALIWAGVIPVDKNALHEVDANALDLAVKAGWAATRYLPTVGDFVTVPENRKLPSAQKNTIWDAIVKHNISLSRTPDEIL